MQRQPHLEDLFYKPKKIKTKIKNSFNASSKRTFSEAASLIETKPSKHTTTTKNSDKVICLNTPAMRLYHYRTEPHLRAKQGALDLNAYLLQRLKANPNDPCIVLLYCQL